MRLSEWQLRQWSKAFFAVAEGVAKKQGAPLEDTIATGLKVSLRNGDEVVWDVLERTGETNYALTATWLKAAEVVRELAKERGRDK